MRTLFLAYVGRPTPGANTALLQHRDCQLHHARLPHDARHIVGYLPLDYRLLLSGYLPSYVYKMGGLDSRYSLEQLRSFGHITDRAKAADQSERFSADIRAGIPALPGASGASASVGEE